MKTIIAGSRTLIEYDLVKRAIEQSSVVPTEIVCGGAKGVDTLGAQWAKENNLPIKFFYAQWDVYGKSAGYIRNEAMARYAEALIAIWDGKSPGTKHMIDIAKRMGLAIDIPTLNK